MNAEARAALEAAKARSLVQRLFRVARRLDEVARARVSARTGRALRQAHTAVLPHVDLDGTRLTELAGRLGVTKQSLAPVVDELVAWGVLEKVPDPADGRGRLLRFPDATALLEGLGELRELEADLRGVAGDGATDAVSAWLGAVEGWLDAGAPR